MRICLYSEKILPKIGGQELVVDALARGLLASGHEPIVLAPRGRERSNTYDRELPYQVVRHPRFYSTRRFVGFYKWWLARAHRRYGFDIVHCHGVYPSGYIAARYSAVADLPLVITSHGGDLDPLSPLYRKRGLDKRYRLALDRARAVVALSDFLENRLRSICPQIQRIERIGNGIDLIEYGRDTRHWLSEFTSFAAGKYFLFLGRLVPRKGADMLLEAFARMQHRRDVSLVIAGAGRQQPELQSMAVERGLQDSIHFVGEVRDDRKICLLQNAFCVVMPSRVSEAFGLVALEAFAARRPVIATGIPGLSELVEQDKTGMLVAEDSVEELARAMDKAVAEPDEMERLGRGAYQRAREFDWSNVVRRHVELYEDLVGRANSQRVF